MNISLVKNPHLSLFNRINSIETNNQRSVSLVNFKTLEHDVFVKNTVNNVVSFKGIIPQKAVEEVSTRALEFMRKARSSKRADSLAEAYFNRIMKLVHIKPKNDEETHLLRLFRHELVNSVHSRLMINVTTMGRNMVRHLDDIEYLAYQKTQFQDIVNRTTATVRHWSRLELWQKNKPKTAEMKELQESIQTAIEILKDNTSSKITILNEDMVKNKKIQNPYESYNKISQIVLNAIKYGENKPIIMRYDKQVLNGQEVYFLNVINEGTHAIPNGEIDKILSGQGYRASHTRDSIKGSGLGFIEIIQTLKDQGLGCCIPNLIEKNRQSGVRVLLPLNIVD